MITLVVARSRNGAIGRDGSIPWRIPEDLKFFKRETLGGALIMGRRTWSSLPVKPLAERLNIVVSSRSDVAEIVVPSVMAGISRARNHGYQRLYGIGGAGIYEEMLPLAHRLLISEVDLEIEDADTFFPRLDTDGWHEVDRRPLRSTDPKCNLREFVKRK